MKLPPLLSLRAFEAVARTGSVSRAAEELCVSHSAVSQHIRKLEEWLGLPLVEPNGRGIRLTEAGDCYKAKVCEAFSAIHMQTELLRDRGASSPVRVACFPAFAQSWLMPQVHDFWEKHPDVQLAIEYSSPASNTLDPLAVDIAVRDRDPRGYPDFIAMPILESVSLPFASPEYLQRVGYKGLRDVARLTMLHIIDRAIWQLWLSAHECDPCLAEAGVIYPNTLLALGACLAGEGVAMLPRDLVLAQMRAKVLVPLSERGVQGDSYFVFTPRCRPLPRGALVFIEWMRSLPGALRLGMPSG